MTREWEEIMERRGMPFFASKKTNEKEGNEGMGVFFFFT